MYMTPAPAIASSTADQDRARNAYLDYTKVPKVKGAEVAQRVKGRLSGCSGRAPPIGGGTATGQRVVALVVACFAGVRLAGLARSPLSASR